MRGFFGGVRGQSSALCSYEVSRFLSVFPRGISGGFRLVSRVERGRTLWRVASADCKPAPACVLSNSGIVDAPGPALVCPSQAPENVCDGLTPADYLASNLRKALRRQAELLDLPLDPADSRLNRLIAEVANQTVNAVVRAQEKSLAAKRDDEQDRAMEALFEERMKKAQLEIDRLNAAGSRTVHVTYNRMNQSRMRKETE
jgi:hypothetical protein